MPQCYPQVPSLVFFPPKSLDFINFYQIQLFRKCSQSWLHNSAHILRVHAFYFWVIKINMLFFNYHIKWWAYDLLSISNIIYIGFSSSAFFIFSCYYQDMNLA